MECAVKNELEQHLSDIRTIAARVDLSAREQEAAVRAEQFAIDLLNQHNASGHDGKRCPFGTVI
jgi:hypothetical protein